MKSRVLFSGVGLHSGAIIKVEVLPAQADSGIVFIRVDRPDAEAVLASAHNVSSTALSTTLGFGNSSIATVEHFLAAMFGLGVDNALVRVCGPEMPILDGSAGPFVEGIIQAGLVPCTAIRRRFFVRKPFEVKDGDKVVRLSPAPSLRFDCSIDFPSSAVIGRQSLKIDFNAEAFRGLCRARTFCHIQDLEHVRAAGLAKGGSLENAVVVSEDSVINMEGLRYRDEFVRHKLLDGIGDMSLLGMAIVGRFSFVRAGHALHCKFARELLNRANEYLIPFDAASSDVAASMDVSMAAAFV